MRWKISYNLWFMAARVLPLFALALTLIFYFIDANTLLECILLISLVIFVFIAIYWWWWIMVTSKDLFKLIEKTNKTFIDVMDEVKEIKKDIKDVNNR